jgi:predicted acetyltransferase
VTIEIRATRPDEYRRAADVFTAALMVAPPSDERWERIRPTWEGSHSFSAWDGERCVGHAAHTPVETTVPGGATVPTGAVSRVGVLPTDRRRGVARDLVHAVIGDATDRNMVLLSLRASESTIYGRFGFGVAGDWASAVIDPRRARPVRCPEAPGVFRLLERTEVLSTVEPLYLRVGRRRPGAITRPTLWSERYLDDAIEGDKASFVAVHEHDGVPDGYVHYTVNWTDGDDPWRRGAGEIHDLFGETDAIELALWSYVLNVDLVDEWKAEERPVDDLVRDVIHDRRGYQLRQVEDEQWLRIVDVDAALAARTYHDVGHSVVVEVSDPLIPANNGSWRVWSDGAERTDEPSDLAVDIRTLSALYLGGPSWSASAGVGDVAVARPGAVAVADSLFVSRRAPFCGSFF